MERRKRFEALYRYRDDVIRVGLIAALNGKFFHFSAGNKAPAKPAQAPTEPFQPLPNLRVVCLVFSAWIRNGSHRSSSFSLDPSARHPSAEIRGSSVEWDGEGTTEEEDRRWWRGLVVRRLLREEGWREETMEKKMKGDNVKRKKMNRKRKRKREKRKQGECHVACIAIKCGSLCRPRHLLLMCRFDNLEIG